MNIKEIKELLELMAEHNVGEIEIEKDNAKIKLRKMANGGIVMQSAPQTMAPMQTIMHAPAQAGAPKPSLLQLLRAPILAKLEPEGEGRILNAHLQVRHHLVIIIIIMNAHLQVRHHLVIIIKRCSGSI